MKTLQKIYIGFLTLSVLFFLGYDPAKLFWKANKEMTNESPLDILHKRV